MRKRLAVPILLVLAASAGRTARAGDGGEEATGPIFFREPDRETGAHIAELIAQMATGSVPDREKKRRELQSIGSWSVEPLLDAVARLEPPKVCAAILVLDAIHDRRAVDPLRATVAKETAHPYVAAFATLCLGRFGDASSVEVFRSAVKTTKLELLKAAVPFAAAKIRTADARDLVIERVRAPGDDDRHVGGCRVAGVADGRVAEQVGAGVILRRRVGDAGAGDPHRTMRWRTDQRHAGDARAADEGRQVQRCRCVQRRGDRRRAGRGHEGLHRDRNQRLGRRAARPGGNVLNQVAAAETPVRRVADRPSIDAGAAAERPGQNRHRIGGPANGCAEVDLHRRLERHRHRLRAGGRRAGCGDRERHRGHGRRAAGAARASEGVLEGVARACRHALAVVDALADAGGCQEAAQDGGDRDGVVW